MVLPSLFHTIRRKSRSRSWTSDTQGSILDKDGKIVTEEKEIEIPCFSARSRSLISSQTDGKPLPELAPLSGNVPNYEAFMDPAPQRTGADYF